MTTASHVTCSPQHIPDKGRVGAASHEDDNKTPRYLGQPAGGTRAATACLSGPFFSSRVTYGVAGRAMFDAPLVKNREAARSLARRGQVLGRLGQGHEQRRRWQADSTLMLTILALAGRRCVHARLRV